MLNETCDHGKVVLLRLRWQLSTFKLGVMDVSQIKNVAFSLGELPSNVIRLYYLKNMTFFPVRDQPYIGAFLLALGSVQVARTIYQALSVLFQTFILSGTSVCSYSNTEALKLSDGCVHS